MEVSPEVQPAISLEEAQRGLSQDACNTLENCMQDAECTGRLLHLVEDVQEGAEIVMTLPGGQTVLLSMTDVRNGHDGRRVEFSIQASSDDPYVPVQRGEVVGSQIPIHTNGSASVLNGKAEKRAV
ncbi:MAG: hypothetical protein Q7R81_07465 [Candidatus Peregrinibacteria bacterium]|nr:hypothetical protein [Candidatus Peregrinibacteria bacterium]